MTLVCNNITYSLWLFEALCDDVIYVIIMYVSSHPGTYMVRTQFAFWNWVWQNLPWPQLEEGLDDG
jgi:hypothetical protein